MDRIDEELEEIAKERKDPEGEIGRKYMLFYEQKKVKGSKSASTKPVDEPIKEEA